MFIGVPRDLSPGTNQKWRKDGIGLCLIIGPKCPKCPRARASLVRPFPADMIVDPDPHPFADHRLAADPRRADQELPRRLAHGAGKGGAVRGPAELDAI